MRRLPTTQRRCIARFTREAVDVTADDPQSFTGGRDIEYSRASSSVHLLHNRSAERSLRLLCGAGIERRVRTTGQEVRAALLERFHGDTLGPGDPGFLQASSIWNGMVQRTPGAVLRCADIADIQTAVRAAGAAGALTAVRCGGHSLAGFSSCDGGVVIDLSRLRGVAVDESRRRARVQGGCLLGTVDDATQRVGLVFPSGVVSHTGASGLILGGGTGWLTRLLGLSCDNVEGFTLITADGS